MERPIEVGDLVVCVGGCGCHLGKMFTVRNIRFHDFQMCLECHFPVDRAHYAYDETINHLPLSWLKRIPPISEPSTDEQEMMA